MHIDEFIEEAVNSVRNREVLFGGVTNYQSRRAHHTPLGGIFCHL